MGLESPLLTGTHTAGGQRPRVLTAQTCPSILTWQLSPAQGGGGGEEEAPACSGIGAPTGSAFFFSLGNCSFCEWGQCHERGPGTPE